MTTMSLGAGRARTPWHLWVVGVLALLFEGFGCFQYVMAQTGGDDFVRESATRMGWTAAQAETYIQWGNTLPVWSTAVWAVGVWVGLAAAVFLLLRRRIAVPLFGVSLLAFVLNTTYEHLFTNMPDFVRNDLLVPAIIFTGCLLLAVYSWWAGRRGLLR